MLPRTFTQQLVATLHLHIEPPAVGAGKLESHKDRADRGQLWIRCGEAFFAIHAVFTGVLELYDRQIAVGEVWALERCQIFTKRKFASTERYVPGDARLAGPYVTA